MKLIGKAASEKSAAAAPTCTGQLNLSLSADQHDMAPTTIQVPEFGLDCRILTCPWDGWIPNFVRWRALPQLLTNANDIDYQQ